MIPIPRHFQLTKSWSMDISWFSICLMRCDKKTKCTKTYSLCIYPSWILHPSFWWLCKDNRAVKGVDVCWDFNFHFFIFAFSYTDWDYGKGKITYVDDFSQALPLEVN